MTRFWGNKFLATKVLESLLVLLTISHPISVLAHGDEDHGESKPVTVTNTKGAAVTRTARAGDLEITLKHQPFEPDTETTGKLFVTKYETNEPFTNSTPAIEITTADGKVYEALEIKSGEPGVFSFKLPPLPQGTYTISTRLSSSNKSETATFANVAVEPQHVESPADLASWARTALLALAGILVLGLLGAFSYFALLYARRNGASEGISKEAVSA